MSKTPRTDNQLKLDAFFDGIGIVETVEVEFAQELETELADARAEIERLKRCCNCEYANHKLEICMHPDNEPETFMDGVCDQWSHNI